LQEADLSRYNNMYKNKKISITIPCYNESKFIIDVIKNIPDFVDKIIVVDDCSKDDTLKILTSFAIDFDRLKVLQNVKNLGVGGSTQRGSPSGIPGLHSTIIFSH
jgi:glycosyltransferase involved in cell wall biosynthesis